MANTDSQPIAIVGIGCRLPGNVQNTDDLWQLLIEGRNAWSPVPAERFNEDAFHHPNPDNNGTTNHRGGHFIGQDVAVFDASFFGISPIEASAMDPQQRLLLETTYEAFENAGIPIEKARGSQTAVYTATFTHDYDRNLYRDPLDIPKYHTTGTGDAIVANRVSYTFDFKGPSMSLDTGCSGSMVALQTPTKFETDQACRSLQAGESDLALASGVNLILNPDHMIGMSNLHMLSDYGRSFSFDERGAGYGRGEGIVTVLLKRLDDAIAAGDNIRSVICNTAVNQDGKTSGITLPSQQAQEAIQRLIYSNCGLDPHSIDYIEAHGTGTAAGDLAELKAIKSVFCGNSRQSDVYVGSVKSNIGHLESSSGLAGLIKTVLILEKGLIPPNSDFQTPKKELDIDSWKIKIPSEVTPWPNSGVRRASVNSFGYGGTNAHAILQSAPETRKTNNIAKIFNGVCSSEVGDSSLETPTDSPIEYTPPESLDGDSKSDSLEISAVPQLFVVSGKSEDSVRRVVQDLQLWASSKLSSEDTYQDLAYTLSDHRSMMAWRHSFIPGSHKELITLLNSGADSSRTISKSLTSQRIGFIFTGQGAQWFSMGRELLHTHSRFAESISESDRILRALGAPWSLFEELDISQQSQSRINESEIAQPASTALQIALVDLLFSFDIVPEMVLGHSSGEIACAYTAGFLSQTEALKISYNRSYIRNHCKKLVPTKGSMIAVGLGEKEVSPMLASLQKGKLSLACVNSPSSTTISGDEDAIIELQDMLNNAGIFNRKLAVDTAYHSHHMQQVAGEYLSSLGSIETQKGNSSIQFVSSVTAEKKTAGFGAEYWVENLVSKVRFSDALEHFCTTRNVEDQLSGVSSNHILIEIGPHSALKGPIRQTVTPELDPFRYKYLPTLLRKQNAAHSILELAGSLFEQGYPVNVKAANSIFRNPSQRRPQFISSLPSYPWDHSNRYWHESRVSKQYRLRKHPYHDLVGVRVASSTSLEPVWTHRLDLERLPWLADHVVDGLVIFPGSGYICMAIEAIHQLTQDQEALKDVSTFILRDVTFSKALVIPSSPSKVETRLTLTSRRDSGKAWEFRVSALSDGDIWYEHCHGLVQVESSSELSDSGVSHFSNIDKQLYVASLASQPQILYSEDIYEQMRSNGNFYGPCFRAIDALEISDLKAIGRISIPNVQSTMPANHIQPHIIHPSTLDVLLHTSLPVFSNAYGPGSVMPTSIGKITIRSDISNKPRDELISHTVLDPKGRRSAIANVLILTPESKLPVLEISDLEIRGLGEAQEVKLDLPRDFSYQMKWGVDVEHAPFDKQSDSLAGFLKDLHFKHSNLNILQANLSAAHVTNSILLALSGLQNNGISSYDVVDTPDERFKSLQSRFPTMNQALSFKNNDLEDPIFETTSYDLIILTVKDMGDLSETLISKAHKLLKPSGWLILFSEINNSFTKEVLHPHLLHHGFDGLKLLSNDGEKTKANIAIAKPTLPDHRSLVPSIQLRSIPGTEDFTQQLCTSLQNGGFSATTSQWNEKLTESDAIQLVIDNGQNPFLVNPSANDFKHLVDIVGATKANVLWVSGHQNISAATNSQKGLIVGFARSASAENEHLKFVTLDVQDAYTSDTENLLHAIEEILTSSFGGGKLLEKEFSYKNGQILIPRLISDLGINTWIAKSIGKPTVESVTYSTSDRPLKLDLESASAGDSLYFVDDDCSETLGASEIQILIKAGSVSQIDDVKNMTKETSKHIREFSGIVDSIGTDSSSGLQVGDRVCGWSYDDNPYASHVRIDVENAIYLPNKISLRTGSIIPFAFMTAYYSLVELAQLEKEQTILIHYAEGDIGRAALALAQDIGAKIFATVLSKEDKELIIEQFGLQPEHVFYEQATSLKQNIFQFTNGVGVDAVLNPLMNDSNQDSSACIATYGTYIHTGQPGSLDLGLENRAFVYRPERNATFVSFDLGTLMRTRPRKLSKLLQKATTSLPQSEELLSSNTNTYVSPENLRDAFKYLSHKHHGSIVLEVTSDSQVKVLSRNQPVAFKEATLDPNATYVMAGGLGDLGQRLCDLMAMRGAKNLVLLSRRAASSDHMAALTKHLEGLSSGCKVFSIPCDIASQSKVQDAVIAIGSLGLPPVKGVIQTATVLQDLIIERMTLDNFNVPLETKLHGTSNLKDAFESPELDFFVMLSSLSGVIGTMGQANYDSGNTYQDTVAQNQPSSTSRFMSVDLGLITGTSVYEGAEGETRMQNLTRQGMIPVLPAELDAVLDYAISPQARKDKCKQAVIGIDGASIIDAANATPTTQSALFVHVRSSGLPVAKLKENSADRKRTLADATTLEEAHSILTEAIVERVSSLTSLTPSQISLDTPLPDFGLDSLTAIELKNWISKEFDSAIQASEILDEPSIPSLAMRIAARSSILHNPSSNDAENTDTKDTSSKEILTLPINGDLKDANGPAPFKTLPLPDLSSTMEQYLSSARLSLSEKQLSYTIAAIKELIEGPGPELQKRLAESRTKDENWPHANLYLRRRDPAHPYGMFYGSHILSEIPHTQAERAAIVSLSAWDFKEQLDSGLVKQEVMSEQPLCMDSWNWLFNGNRTPYPIVDKMDMYPNNDYFVVLRRGHVFKVRMAQNMSRDATFTLLKDTFATILSLSEEKLPAVTALTLDERTSWAGLREVVKGAGKDNTTTLEAIEASTFVLCLDDESPETPTERCNQFLYGDPSNRWADKPLQFVVTANGASAFICEHTMLDAASMMRINKLMTNAILDYKPEPTSSEVPVKEPTSALQEELTFHTTPELESNISRTIQTFRTVHNRTAEYMQFYLPTLSKKFFASHKIPAKAGCHLVIQLASLMQFGVLHPCWEALTTMFFRLGRVDFMQVVTPAMQSFCDALLSTIDLGSSKNKTFTTQELKALMRSAIALHTSTATKNIRGKGFLSHCHALREVVLESEPLPKFFSDPTWSIMLKSAPRKIKTDSSSGMQTSEIGYLVPDPEALLVHYEAEEESCFFWIQGMGVEPERFRVNLERAAGLLRGLLAGDGV